MKVCNKCQEEKQENDFYPHRGTCIPCVKERCKIYRQNHPESIKKYFLSYKITHQNELKKYRQSLIQKGYYKKHYKNGYSEHRKKYYLNNKSKISLYRKQYSQTDNYKKARKSYREKMYLNPLFKLRINTSRRIREVLKGNSKSSSTIHLIGCSPQKLREYLEAKFQKGMTWDNYGLYGWHIDHIRPCASFDLSKPEEQKKCFHYSNLQPLWAKDNIIKGNKLVPYYFLLS